MHCPECLARKSPKKRLPGEGSSMIEVTVSPARLPAGAADLNILLTNIGPNAYLNVIFTIKLPVGVIRLRGSDRITATRLAPGQSIALPLRVRTNNPGRYRLTSPNFSYRDHTGHPHREHHRTAEFMVDENPAAEPEPDVSTELMTSDLPLGEWSTVRVRVSNGGEVDVTDLRITLSGQVTTEDRTRTFTLERLPAGSSVDASFFVRAQETGDQVPVHLDIAYREPRRRPRHHHDRDSMCAQQRPKRAPTSTGLGLSNKSSLLRSQSGGHIALAYR